MKNELIRYSTILCLFFLQTVVNAQNIDCITDTSKAIDPLNLRRYMPDTIYVSFAENPTGFSFTAVNTTNDTLFLFGSYLTPEFYSSKYIHKVNKKEKLYKISFLPYLPYLSHIPDDRRYYYDRIIKEGQLKFKFIMLVPRSTYKFEIAYTNLFKNNEQKNNLIWDFENKKTSRFKPLKFKFATANKLKSEYTLAFEFACYKQISILCGDEMSGNDSLYNQASSSYELLEVPVHSNLNYKWVKKE